MRVLCDGATLKFQQEESQCLYGASEKTHENHFKNRIDSKSSAVAVAQK
jgi:hypothetical protein